MKINGTIIEDTHAEAFAAWATKVIVTAADGYWLEAGLREATGYGTSVIGCDAEVGLLERLEPGQTPDGRCGASILLFARRLERLAEAVANRAGQALLTCSTVSVFAGIGADGEEEGVRSVELGDNVRYFGDGFEDRVDVGGRSCWAIPVMDGDCVIEGAVGAIKAVAGGNILVCGEDQPLALDAARRAAEAVARCADVVAPFPGGVVRSGSKVGSRYNGLIASTNDAYCPTLRGRTRSRLADDVGCVYELVIDGLTLVAVQRAMRAGITAACGPGISRITAANFDGRLGKIRINLHDVLAPVRDVDAAGE